MRATRGLHTLHPDAGVLQLFLSCQSLARRHCSRCAQNARARTRPCLDYHYAHYCACVGSSLVRTPPPCISPAWPGLFTLPQCRSQTPSSSFPPVSIHERDLFSTNFLQDDCAKISNSYSFLATSAIKLIFCYQICVTEGFAYFCSYIICEIIFGYMELYTY